MIAFAELLKVYREDRGLSQSKLAARAGYDRSYLSYLESARSAPVFETVTRLANALDLSVYARRRLLASAGFFDAAGDGGMLFDPDVQALSDLLFDTGYPESFRESIRTSVRSLIASAAYVTTESRAA
jgi:transcriptional regulator with XRE-family HTH domain